MLKKTYLPNRQTVLRFSRSIWLFPVIATIGLILLTSLRINGSSIGIYYPAFNGNHAKDPALVRGHPRAIRSDEWVVNTPLTIGQKSDDYKAVNSNLGNGQDMSILGDMPYRGWSEIFKPHNLSFLALPFDYAFAFKWWFMAYALLLSTYFLALAILPGKRLVASCLAIALLLSAFVQWWYQYQTIGPIYYSFLLCLIAIHIFRTKKGLHRALLAAAFSYIAACFALVLYPPFQIVCLLIAGLFILGTALTNKLHMSFRDWLKPILWLAGAGVVSLAFVLLFVLTHSSVIKTINSTAYPGRRVVASGGYSATHLLSGSVGYQFTNDDIAPQYSFPQSGIANQSEASTFLFVGLFTIVPSVWLYAQQWMRKKNLENIDITHLLVILGVIILLAWLFIPGLGLLGKLVLLDKVPLNRSIIGLGLANTLLIMLFIRQASKQSLNSVFLWVYTTAALALSLYINWRIHELFPGFLGKYRACAFALIIPLIVYLLMRRLFVAASILFALVSFVIGIKVNPIYRGTAILTNSPIVTTIEHTSGATTGRWVTEDGTLENFFLMAGVPSLSGVYNYPQNQLWRPIDHGREQSTYNRYAHVNFVLDRDVQQNTPTTFVMPTLDHFGVSTEPCGSFLKNSDVTFILTSAPLYDSCLSLQNEVNLPTISYFIYRIH